MATYDIGRGRQQTSLIVRDTDARSLEQASRVLEELTMVTDGAADPNTVVQQEALDTLQRDGILDSLYCELFGGDTTHMPKVRTTLLK